jgi:acylphosphatase
MTENEIIRLHVLVEGRVQGVGFRAFVESRAASLPVTGWVRNRWDGTVEVVAEGERSVLEKLLVAVSRGPGAGYVSRVVPDWGAASGEFNGFYIRSTW